GGGAWEDWREIFPPKNRRGGQRLYPFIDNDNGGGGVRTRREIADLLADTNHAGSKLADLARQDPVVAYPDEPLRAVVYRMAETGFTRMPVVERGNSRKLVGMISLEDLLGARTRNLTEQRERERG